MSNTKKLIKISNKSQLHKKIHFTDSVPQSTIVFKKGKNKLIYFKMQKNDFLLYVKECAYLLFNKYINYGSYEVDINKTNQRKIANKMDNKDDWLTQSNNFQDLIILFEEICNEIFQSMLYSFFRFKRKQSEM